MIFTEICNEYVKTQYEKANLILEYGSVGSTLLAAKLAEQIMAVGSCNSWLVELPFSNIKVTSDVRMKSLMPLTALSQVVEYRCNVPKMDNKQPSIIHIGPEGEALLTVPMTRCSVLQHH